MQTIYCGFGYVTCEYINITADKGILKEEANYLESNLLEDGQDERYEETKVSNEKGTIYEHILRAINRALIFGDKNLPLMGSGDWNDGMNTVGNKGKGQSVWLRIFLV